MRREPIHPGEFLIDELIEFGITATELSRRIGAPPNRISQIIHGKRDMTADTALRLGKFLGTGPKLWMNLQKAYEIDQVKSVDGGPNRTLRVNRLVRSLEYGLGI